MTAGQGMRAVWGQTWRLGVLVASGELTAEFSWSQCTSTMAWLCAASLGRRAVSPCRPCISEKAPWYPGIRPLPPVLLTSLVASARAGCGIVHGDVTSSNVLLQRCAAPQRRRCSPPPTPSSNAASATPSSTAALPVPRSPWEPSSQSGDTAAAPVPAQRNVLVQDHKATAQDTGTALFPATGPGSASRQEAAAMCGPTQSTGRGSLPPAEGATGAYLQPDTAYAAGGGGGGGSTILSSGCLAAATCSSLSTLLQPAQQGQEPTLQQGNTQQQQQPGFACAANAGAPGVTHKDWDQHPLCDVAPVAAPAPEAPWQPLPGVNVSPAADAALRAASGAGWTEELRTPQLDPLDELRAALGLRFKAKVGGWRLKQGALHAVGLGGAVGGDGMCCPGAWKLLTTPVYGIQQVCSVYRRETR